MGAITFNSKVFVALIILAIIAISNMEITEALPLVGRGGPSSRRSFLRDPMPWEDGYFDPSYHAWPKGKQSDGGDKKAIK